MNLKFSTHLTKQELVHQSSVLIRIKNLQLIQYDLELSLSNTQLRPRKIDYMLIVRIFWKWGGGGTMLFDIWYFSKDGCRVYK